MGGFNPITTALSLVGANRAFDTGASYRAAQQHYALNEKIAAENARADKEKLVLETAEDDRKRREALRRAVARQRTQFAAQGIDASDGSGQAVLLGLFEENDAERAYREKLNRIRLDAIDRDYANTRRKNLLSLQGGYDAARSGITGTGLNTFIKLQSQSTKDN